MEELIARVTAATGLDAATAQQAIGHVIAFLQKEAPEASQRLVNEVPGAADAAAAASAGEGGGG